MPCSPTGSSCSATARCAATGAWSASRVLALGLSATATWFLVTVSTRVQRRFRDKVTIALESHVATLLASITTIAHHERPEYLDRLSVLRNQVFMLDHMYMSLFSTCGWILRLAVTVALLASIHPALVLLTLCALPPVFTSSWRPGVERRAQERGAQANRLSRHLFDVATTAAPGKDVRVTGIAATLAGRRRQTWEAGQAPIAAARWASALWHAAAWAVFGAGYVGAIVFVTSGVGAPAGDVLLTLAAGSRLSFYVGAAVGEIGFLRGVWMDSARRLAWLEDYAAAVVATAEQPAPRRLTRGVRFDHVSFAYPGHRTARARGRVARPARRHGGGDRRRERRRQDHAGEAAGQDVRADARPHPGRRRGSGGGVGRRLAHPAGRRVPGLLPLRVPRPPLGRRSATCRASTTMPAVATAVNRAGADDVVTRLPAGLDTQLGPTWPGGVEVSFGQWQKLALARGFMRDRPLLLVLDEPTAALDAETEHALFERYAAAVRGDDGEGRITILVSHRFSTVRMADLIVVLDGARVVETGTARGAGRARRPVRPALRPAGGRLPVAGLLAPAHGGFRCW